jgi:hypothetical protein
MKEFETLIQIGRKMAGSRGGEVQLEGDKAFLTNIKRSSLYLFEFKKPIGTGTFYSSQALINAETVERRDDRVWFVWKENGVTRREFVPDLDKLTDFEKVFKEKYNEDQIEVSKKIFDVLLPEFLITRIKINNNRLILTQIRSDGDVGFENEIPLSSGLEKVEYPDTEEISVFTSDLLILQSENTLSLSLKENLSLKISTRDFTCKAVIGSLIYESA